jgi:hypothetical protein
MNASREDSRGEADYGQLSLTGGRKDPTIKRSENKLEVMQRYRNTIKMSTMKNAE